MPEICRWAVIFIPFVGLVVILGGLNGTVAFMKIRQSGFTLIELMVTVAIAVLLTSLALPGFQSMLVGRRVDAAADMLVSDFRFARSEAIKRTNQVTICASSNGTSCTGAGALWRDGWIVFVDENAGGTVDGNDIVMRVQEALTGISAIAASDGTARANFVFQSTGLTQSASQTFIVTPSTGSGVRLICVSNKGRAALRAKGETTC